ncbi:MAG: SDR family NAD(P)-dependent oxidoreductase [Parvibaculales bacterium]
MSQSKAIVTGASGTLGAAVSRHLAGQGWAVTGIDYADTPGTFDDFDRFYGGVDLTDAAQAQAAADQAGSVDGLVNVAGGFVWETVMDGSAETWERMWQINLKTCLNMCTAVLPKLSDNGAIVNVGAAATARAEAGMASYTASKSAVARLTEGLAAELADGGRRVNAVLPTIIDTPVNRTDMPDADFSQWVQPDDLAQVIGFLVSPAAAAIHGALIPVRGRL